MKNSLIFSFSMFKKIYRNKSYKSFYIEFNNRKVNYSRKVMYHNYHNISHFQDFQSHNLNK